LQYLKILYNILWTVESTLYIGCAGWAIPPQEKHRFPEQGSHLERYATCFNAVEINSSFYRSHKPETYAKWASMVPNAFRFSVKVPKQITHVQKLKTWEGLDRFGEETKALREKLGPWLIQLPPSLAFDESVARHFFEALRKWYEGSVVIEPRHDSWFSIEVETVFLEFKIARVIADPPISPIGTHPGGWTGLVYFRLHGSPQMYRSSYTETALDHWAEQIRFLSEHVPEIWCIFDNTASGSAIGNAITLKKVLSHDTQR